MTIKQGEQRSSPRSVRWPAAVTAVALLVLLAVIGARLYAEATYVDFNHDKARQLLIARSVDRGLGFTLVTADPNNLASDVKKPTPQWPVGYPWLIALVADENGDLLAAAQAVDFVGVAVLIMALFGLAAYAGVGHGGLAWLAALSACTFAPYHWLGSTDLLAVAAYMFAVWLVVWWSATPKASLLLCVIAGVALSAGAAMRFAYYPLALVLPFLLAASGMIARDGRRIAGGTLVLVAAMLPIAGLMAVHFAEFGSVMRSGAETDQWYPENLAHFDAFPLHGLVYGDFVTDNVHVIAPWLDSWLRAAELLLSVAILLVVCAPALNWLRRRTPAEPLGLYHGAAVVTIIANTLLFAWVSLTQPPQTDWIDFFTHVQETRYYAPAMLMVQISVVLWAFSGRRRIGRVVLALVLLFSAAHASYRVLKVHALGQPTIQAAREEEVERSLAAARALVGDDLRHVVWADHTSMQSTCLVALHSDARIVINTDELLAQPPRTESPIDLFVALPHARKPAQVAWLADAGAEPVLQLAAAQLFWIRLRPK